MSEAEEKTGKSILRSNWNYKDTNKKVGATISLTPPEEGDNIWHVSQVDTESDSYGEDEGSSRSIDWSFGPYKV